MRRFVVCLLLIIPLTQVDRVFSEEKPESFLESLPAEARASLTIRNLEELDGQYRKHLQRNNEFGFKQMVTLGLGFLKITEGVDWNGTFSLALMGQTNSDNYEDEVLNLVLRVPFTNLDAMAKNFALTKEETEAKPIHLFGKRLNNDKDVYVSFQKNHILVSLKQEPLEQYLNSKPMSGAVVSDPGSRLSKSDVLFQIEPRSIKPDDYERRTDKWVDRTFAGEPEEMRELARQIMYHMDQTFVSLKIDGGVHFRVHATLLPDLPEELQQTLQEFAEPSSVPDLRGFPKGNLLLALSKAADRDQNETIRNRSIAWLLEQTVQNQSISSLVLPYLDPRSDTFQGLIDEIWNSIVEARSAVYLNENIKENGMGNLLVILRPETPDGFIDQLSSLVKFSRGAVYNPRTQKADKVTEEEIEQLIEQLGAPEFKVRKAATLRLKLLGDPALPHLEKSAQSRDEEVARRSKSLLVDIRNDTAHHAEVLIKEGLTALPLPEFVLYENQRTIEGFPADVMVAHWNDDDLISSKRVQELAGPMGHEILIVHAGEEVVLFWGSDRTLLTQCLQLLKSGQPGLNEQRKPFAGYAAPQRLIETHLSVQKFARMVPEAFARKPPENVPSEDFSSFGVEITPQHLIGDAFFPLPEFLLIARYLFLF